MGEILERVQRLTERGTVKISDHGRDELADDDIFVKDVLGSIGEAAVVEEYPTYYKGPCVLVLQCGAQGEPIHVVWGIPKGKETPAVLVTAYRPDPDRWSDDYKRRMS